MLQTRRRTLASLLSAACASPTPPCATSATACREPSWTSPVVDQTGLTGRYDFTLNWTPDESQFAVLGGYHAPAEEDPNAPPSLSTAIQEQLGLKLENTKAKVDTFVIDHLEKPTAN